VFDYVCTEILLLFWRNKYSSSFRSFQRRVFPVNHLHWQPNKNNQETEATNNTKQAVGGGRHDMPPPLSSTRGRRSVLRRRADGNVAAVSHGQHVPTPTAAAAWRANRAMSKVTWWPWPLTFWPWKRCTSHMWRGLPLCQFWSFKASLFWT